MVVTLTQKSGKGLSDRQTSELSAFFKVIPGHEDQVAAAIKRFGPVTDNIDAKSRMQIGLRELRLVQFDNGTRLLWATSFETDWDPYIDDGIDIIGTPAFIDWMQHTEEYPYPDSPMTATHAEIKHVLQSAQVQASWFHDSFGSLTAAQVLKAVTLETAFQCVLDNPQAAEALQHPALAPLLALASS